MTEKDGYRVGVKILNEPVSWVQPISIKGLHFNQLSKTSFGIDKCIGLDILKRMGIDYPWLVSSYANGLLYMTINSFDRLIYVITINGRLLGGKGGFGSQLREEGKMSTKRRKKNDVPSGIDDQLDAYKDLSGKRLGTSRKEARLAELQNQLPEQARKAENERRNKTGHSIKHPKSSLESLDMEYTKQSRSICENLENAVLALESPKNTEIETPRLYIDLEDALIDDPCLADALNDE
jgi:hypothetical protein